MFKENRNLWKAITCLGVCLNTKIFQATYEQARTFAGDFQFTDVIFNNVDANACLHDLLEQGFIEKPYIAGFKLTSKATSQF